MLITHGACRKTWSGNRAAHCGGEKSVVVPLAVWDGDPGFLAKRYAELNESPVDARGVTAELLADLVSAQSTGVQPRRWDPPPGVPVFRGVLVNGQWAEVLWAVVGLVAVDVVNVIIGRDASVEHPVFVGLDVLVRPSPPSQSEVAVTGPVALRLARRDLLTGIQGSNRHPVSGLPAGTAETLLGGTVDDRSAHPAGLDWHTPTLQVRAMCHRTFSGITAFDQHQTEAGCHDPATRRLVPVEKSWGVLWAMPNTGEQWWNRDEPDEEPAA
jgi:hypothetical protein